MSIYWQPLFQPGRPVELDWDAKVGNGDNGWGNQELQHYTSRPENVFLCVPSSPLACGDSRSPGR